MPTSLRTFLLEKMKMTGPYQPVIIRALLEHGGKAAIEQIAIMLATFDKESIAYYKDKLKIYPKAVLKKHGVATLEKDEYSLNPDLIPQINELQELKEICDQKIADYYSNSPDTESESRGWGLLRVKMITAHPYCGYCGARPGPESDTELDIDHIKPRAEGGSDDVENLQVLCHRCNRAKGHYAIANPKASVIRENVMAYTADCLFCKMPPERILFKNEYVYAIRDAYAVTEGHTLIIPTRHIADAGQLNDTEIIVLMKAYRQTAAEQKKEDPTICGFNIGFNIGKAAGQTIFHAHFHVIPRREGDTDDPIGGIRNVIPGKGNYRK